MWCVVCTVHFGRFAMRPTPSEWPPTCVTVRQKPGDIGGVME